MHRITPQRVCNCQVDTSRECNAIVPVQYQVEELGSESHLYVDPEENIFQHIPDHFARLLLTLLKCLY